MVLQHKQFLQFNLALLLQHLKKKENGPKQFIEAVYLKLEPFSKGNNSNKLILWICIQSFKQTTTQGKE